MDGRVPDEQLAADLAKLEADARLQFENAQIAVPYLRELQEARAALREARRFVSQVDDDGAPLWQREVLRRIDAALGGGS